MKLLPILLLLSCAPKDYTDANTLSECVTNESDVQCARGDEICGEYVVVWDESSADLFLYDDYRLTLSVVDGECKYEFVQINASTAR